MSWPHAGLTDDLLDKSPYPKPGSRARTLAKTLTARDLQAVLVDEFPVTQAAAKPAAKRRRGLAVRRHFMRSARADCPAMTAALERLHEETVLIVRQPQRLDLLANTNVLCHCQTEPLDAGQSDRTVRIERFDAGVHLEQLGYGELPL